MTNSYPTQRFSNILFKSWNLVLLFLLFSISLFSANLTFTNGNANGNISEAGNWSPAQDPSLSDTLIFDGTSVASAFADVNLTVASIKIEAAYTGTIFINPGISLIVSFGGFQQNGGTFDGSSGTLNLYSNLDLTSGIFICPSGNFSIRGGFNITGGTFDHNNGTVILNGGTSASFSSGSAIDFYNLTVQKSNFFFTINLVDTDIRIAEQYISNRGQINGPGKIIALKNVQLTSNHDKGTANLYFEGSQPGIFINQRTSIFYDTVYINKSSPTDVITFQSADNLTTGQLGNQLIIQNGELFFDDGTDFNLDLNITIEANGTLRAAQQTISHAYDLTINGGSFLHNNGTWRCDNSSSPTISSSLPIDFYNLTVQKSSFSNVITLIDADIRIAEQYISNRGKINGPGKIIALKNVQLTSNHDKGTANLYFEGSQPGIFINQRPSTFYDFVYINKNSPTDVITVQSPNNVNFGQFGNELIIQNGELFFDNGFNFNLDLIITIEANGTLRAAQQIISHAYDLTINGGSFLHNNGTWRCDNSSSPTISSSLPIDFYNLTVQKSSFSNVITLIDADIRIAEQYISNRGKINGPGKIIALKNVQLTSNHDKGTANLYFEGSQPGIFINQRPSTFYDFVYINKNSPTDVITVQSPNNVNFGQFGNELIIQNGELFFDNGFNFNLDLIITIEANGTLRAAQQIISHAYDLTINGGSFLHNNGTWRCDNSSSPTISSSLPIDFYNLTVQKSSFSNVITLIDADIRIAEQYISNRGKINGPGKIIALKNVQLTSNHDKGTANLYFEGSQPGIFINQRPSTFYDFVYINKNSPTDVITVQSPNNVNFGQFGNELIIQNGELFFDNGFNFNLDFKITIEANGTLRSAQQIVSHSNDFTNNGGNFLHNNGSWTLDNSSSPDIFSSSILEFYNFKLDKSIFSNIVTLSNTDIRVINQLTLGRGQINGPGNIISTGNVQVLLTFNNGTSNLEFAGNGNQSFDLTGATTTFNLDLIINKPNTTQVILLSNLILDFPGQQLTLTKGIIKSAVGSILQLQGTTLNGGSIDSHIDGPMRLSLISPGAGFTLAPIGKNGTYAPFKVDPTGAGSSIYQVEYFDSDPDNAGYNTDSVNGNFGSIKDCEYWEVTRTSGSATFRAAPSYDDPRSCGTTNDTDFVVATYDGSEWQNQGNSGFDPPNFLIGSNIISPVTGTTIPVAIADSDIDDDGTPDDLDNCPFISNPAQTDTDGDGTGDACDDDDDNDTVLDVNDTDPLNPFVCQDQDNDGCDDCSILGSPDVSNDGIDTDNDGICDFGDPDDDNDDCLDIEDANPLIASIDNDGDGTNDDCDLCIGDDATGDNDNDGTCDDLDPDDDNDGCLDDEDPNPLTASGDSDGDSVNDDCDLCLGDDASGDNDNDGTCDDLDPDDDNDGCLDDEDDNPLTASGDSDGDSVNDDCDLCIGDDATGDNDNDGTCDDLDPDDDNDGCLDDEDDNPLTASGDSDGDSVNDDCDLCIGDDATGDNDNDGTCDDLDPDDDNDGCLDDEDDNPLTASGDSDGDSVNDDCDLCIGDDATGDNDNDGTCDDLDPDDDNDGCLDDEDDNPLIASGDSDGDNVNDDCDLCLGDDATGDNDNDGTCDDLDPDDDNDGCLDDEDDNPLTASGDSDGDSVNDDCDLCIGDDATGDNDNDGTCDDLDPDDDNDGCLDDEDDNPLIASGDSDGDSVNDDCDLCIGDDATGDNDNDGTCDDLDPDDDNDGCLDDEDDNPLTASGDSDGDSVNDDCDLCIGDDATGDNDNDGTCDDLDPDDDNDGCLDDEDDNPLTASGDSDGDSVNDDCDLCIGDDASGDNDNDGTCDDLDPDDDNDGCLDDEDDNPLIASTDSDGDSVNDDCDLCIGDDASGDNDNDGTCDDLDPDDDNDGCLDDEDPNPLLASSDSDGDSVNDDCDLCIGDDASGDNDNDGTCDDLDPDDDNDGCLDDEDPNPLLASSDSDGDSVNDDCDLCIGDDATGDNDNDGTCDDLDPDDDNDGCLDDEDDNPLIASGDSDGDSVNDDCDLCIGDDATGDNDNDGTCDDLDPDDDNDGCLDGEDDNPLIASTDSDGDSVNDDCDLCIGDDATGDNDNDGTCDDLDPDDDNDGCLDGEDDNPLIASTDSDGDSVNDDCDLCIGDDASGDNDNDGTCDDLDPDDDNDGCLDDEDDNPLTASGDSDGDSVNDDCDLCIGGDATGDNDNDGTCDDLDPDDDNDGCLDDEDDNPLTASGDSDGDSVNDDCDLCIGDDATGDNDNDGTCDDLDPDDDNDGCLDDEDDNPLIASTDSDGDSVNDDCDLCIGDDASGDNDNDGTCDDLDPDDDNDGCLDDEDDNPLTASGDSDGDSVNDDCDLCIGDDATGDNDNDGTCDDLDPDDDNDGCLDDEDDNPLTASGDSDGDSVNDDCDLCIGDDASGDDDNDGTCDDLDPDDDNDGCLDGEDDNPLIASTDSDGDSVNDDCDLCIGDDATGDDDNDGICNDLDNDEECENGDSDDDGICDEDDNCPEEANPNQEDSDCDGVGDLCDLCDGGDDSVDNNEDGLPDCAFPPEYEDIIEAWKCGNNKVYICHNTNNNPHTNCINKNAIDSHMDHADYLGPCGNTGCQEQGIPEGDPDTDQAKADLDKIEYGFTVFPNPASQEVQVNLYGIKNDGTISMYNQIGKLVWREQINHETYTLNIDLKGKQFVNGIYAIHLQTRDQSHTMQLVINK